MAHAPTHKRTLLTSTRTAAHRSNAVLALIGIVAVVVLLLLAHQRCQRASSAEARAGVGSRLIDIL